MPPVERRVRIGVGVTLLVAVLAGCAGTTAKRSNDVTSIDFRGPFIPEQVVSTGGKVWVVGSFEATSGPNCAIEEVDPATLRTKLYPIPLCALDVTTGNHDIYIAGAISVPDSNDRSIHIEVFDTVTRQQTVLSPTVITLSGSSIAHTALAYGNGSVWFYSINTLSPKVVKISPSTGAVLATITDVPVTGGHFPALAKTAAGLWMTAGPGGSSPALTLLPPGLSTPTPVSVEPPPSAVLWLSTVDNVVWADDATYLNRGMTVLTRLAAFDTSGKQVVDSGPEDVGDMPLVASGRDLWTVGVGARCAGPQRVWRVDPSSGKTTAVLTLRTPNAACLDESFPLQLAATGGWVFVLDPSDTLKPPSVMYRIRVQAYQ